jgi:hypothetical protein
MKVKLGTANRWGTTNSKPPGPIITTEQLEILSRSLIIFIRLFSAGRHMCCVFYKPLQRVQLCWAKTNFLSQTAYFGFFWAPLEMLSLTLHFWYDCAQNGVIQHCWHSHGSQCPFAVAIESKFLLQRTINWQILPFIEDKRNEL